MQTSLSPERAFAFAISSQTGASRSIQLGTSNIDPSARSPASGEDPRVGTGGLMRVIQSRAPVAALFSTQEVGIDNGPCFRKRLLLCSSRDVIRLCSQELRAWPYMHPPTGPVLDSVQDVSSILNMICVGL